MFFINEKQPSGDYDLFSNPTVIRQFSGRMLTAGMCSVTEQDAEAEREDRLMFPDIGRILAMAQPVTKSFVAQLADAAWLTNAAYASTYATTLSQRF